MACRSVRSDESLRESQGPPDRRISYRRALIVDPSLIRALPLVLILFDQEVILDRRLVPLARFAEVHSSVLHFPFVLSLFKELVCLLQLAADVGVVM